MADDHSAKFNRDLIQNLCLEAGRIMEDTSADLALVLPQGSDEVVARVEQLRQAAEAILALANAAQALAPS